LIDDAIHQGRFTCAIWTDNGNYIPMQNVDRLVNGKDVLAAQNNRQVSYSQRIIHETS
jgi:hypothetical protein